MNSKLNSKSTKKRTKNPPEKTRSTRLSPRLITLSSKTSSELVNLTRCWEHTSTPRDPMVSFTLVTRSLEPLQVVEHLVKTFWVSVPMDRISPSTRTLARDFAESLLQDLTRF